MIKAKKICEWLIAIVLFLMLSINLKEIFERKYSYGKNHDFYEAEENYEVLFLGNSHVMNAIVPIQLMKDYRISSFSLATPDNTMPMNYWTLINSLDYAEPELIVLDCNGMSFSDKIEDAKYPHDYFDSLPLSVNKIRMANDLLDNWGWTSENSVSRVEILWNFYIYHSRWKELSKDDFESQDLFGRGTAYKYEFLPRNIEKINAEKRFNSAITNFEFSSNDYGITYLKKIIDECKKNDIEVLLTYLPGNKYDEIWQKENKKAQEIADEYDVKYLDVINSDIYDEYTDFYGDGDHTNYWGARKVTDYIGKYIRNNYNVTYNSSNISREYIEWIYYENWMVNESKNLEQEVLVFSEKKYNLMIKYNSVDVFENTYYRRFFENLGINNELIRDNNLIIVQEGGKNIHYCQISDDVNCEKNVEIINLFKDKYQYNDLKNSDSDISIMAVEKNDNVTYFSQYYKNYDEDNNIIYVEKE